MNNFREVNDDILKNVSEENRKYAQKQLDVLYDNFIDYLEYWNEKYYRNGFCDGVVLINNSI